MSGMVFLDLLLWYEVKEMNSSIGCKQFYSHSSPNTLCVVLYAKPNQND